MGEPGKWITISGKTLFNLSSNNYLGLADDPRIKEAMSLAIAQYGVGATASRLVVGNFASSSQLEERLARWKEREAALLFSNGYMANSGVIAALVWTR
jgi:8-amino-7-oxononanoate synthase